MKFISSRVLLCRVLSLATSIRVYKAGLFHRKKKNSTAPSSGFYEARKAARVMLEGNWLSSSRLCLKRIRLIEKKKGIQ